MRLNTRQFGELEIEEGNVVHFHEGLIGFEEYKKFIIIADKAFDPIMWLLSIEDPEIEFPVLDPSTLFPKYEPILENKDETDVILAIITLKKNPDQITINLKGPLIIDFKKREGRQIVLDSDLYSPNQPVFNIVKE